jgi:hypothetical protein
MAELPGMLRPVLCVALLGSLTVLPARAETRRDSDWTACRRAITAVEPGSGIPAGLLGAIALVETGRADPSGRPEPWPWSYNTGGEGHAAATKAAAIAEVTTLLASGVRSIDVGCMQVNLLHHPDAFPNLEQAFDPAANTRYAARFLTQLRGRTTDWGDAIARYHSGEAERGANYHRRVALARLGAAWGRGGVVPLPVMRSLAGLCAPGLRPAMLIGGAQEARRFMRPGVRRAVPIPAAAARPRLTCLRSGR